MDLSGFWAIIERSLIGFEGDADHARAQARALRRLLEPLPRDELRICALLLTSWMRAPRVATSGQRATCSAVE